MKALIFTTILFLITGCADYDLIVDEKIKESVDLKLYPKTDTLIVFTDQSTFISSMQKVDTISIEALKIELKKKLGKNIAFTSGRDGVCPVIIDTKKAFNKYGAHNINLLISHEIGHCYQDILNVACKSNLHEACHLQRKGKTLQVKNDLKYEEYVKESFADFIGTYKLAMKSNDDGFFEKKNTINSKAYRGTYPDYRKSSKALDLAKKLYKKNVAMKVSKRESDLELTKLFLDGICKKKEFLDNQCITSTLNGT